MKKILPAILTLIIFCAPLICFAANSANEKLIQMERDTYGNEQAGAILNRINRLEKDYSGKNMQGNMNVRIDAIYEILYGNSGAPSFMAKINAIEWNTHHEVYNDSILERLSKLENEISGKTSNETLIKRIDALTQVSFGADQIPLIEMQIPRDLLIEVEITEDVGSRTLREGDLVDIKVAENVFIDGNLVFAKGLRGTGKVEKVRKAKGWTGKNGKIQIDFYTLNCIDGNNVEIYVGEESQHEMTVQKMVEGASLVGMNLNDDWNKLMVHGKNLEISAGTRLYVQTERTFNIYGLRIDSANLEDMAG